MNHGQIFLIPGYEKYQNLDLKRHIEDQLSIPTIVENDMNAAVIGYMTQRNLKENISLMYLYLGKNGPGAGIAVNGEIVRGKTFFSGEVQFLPQYDHKNFIEALTGDPVGQSMQSIHSVDAISRLVATMTSILNPHYIIFCEDELAPAMLNQIYERSATYVPKEHLPALAVSNLKRDYLNGLQSLGLGLLVSQQIDENN